MHSRLHTLHLKSGCAASGTTDNSFFTTNGIGKGGTIAKGFVRVDYLTSTEQNSIYGPGGRAHSIKVKCPSIPFTDISIGCDDSAAIKRVARPDPTIAVLENHNKEVTGGNQHFDYHNEDVSRHGATGRAFEHFNTAQPINIVLSDISDDAVAMVDWRMGLTFIEILEED